MDREMMFSYLWLGNIMQEMIDTIGVPEFYVTKIGKTEPAGGGCVRVYLCIERGNMLLTQFTVVMPALAMLEAARISQAAALEVFDCCRKVVGAVH
jgi:hypothetical protein